MPTHIAQEGECISSIAAAQGFLWRTVWNDPGNDLLRSQRVNPNHLSPGDGVTLPERAPRQEAAATDKSHRYTVSGTLAMLRLRILEARTTSRRNREPIKAAPYLLNVDALSVEGQTDSDGMIECLIPATAAVGLLVIDRGTPKELRIRLHLGQLGPAAETLGVQARLNNLGFYHGEIDGVMGPDTLAALSAFANSVYLDPDNTERSLIFDALGNAHDRK